MELLLGLIYDAIGIRAIRKEKKLTRKINPILAFTIGCFLLLIILLML